MLRKEDSNKVLKGIKAVVFATGLTMLSSIPVDAQEINQNQIVYENKEDNEISKSEEDGLSLGSIIGLAVLTGMIGWSFAGLDNEMESLYGTQSQKTKKKQIENK